MLGLPGFPYCTIFCDYPEDIAFEILSLSLTEYFAKSIAGRMPTYV